MVPGEEIKARRTRKSEMTKTKFLLFVFIASLVIKPSATTSNDKGKKNVLLIIADDMRAEIGAFIDPVSRPWLNADIKTPHIDALASRSAVFKQAYVQQALCNPSRTSFLTGRRPETTRVQDNESWFTKTGNPNIVSMPSYFHKNGYTTVSLGKVFHHSKTLAANLPETWSLTDFPKNNYDIKTPYFEVSKEKAESKHLQEQMITEEAKVLLKKASKKYFDTGVPFFFAVGYRRPHLPWVCPKKFMDLYPMESIKIPENLMAPQGMPPEAWFRSHDMLNYLPEYDTKEWAINFTLPDQMVKEFRRAYYGCSSYIDHEVGQLVDYAKDLNLLDNTVIVFIGDHGYHIGERGIWGKSTVFENDLLAPLMISLPGLTDGGMERNQLVEFVDLFPTLAEASGLPVPPLCPEDSPLKTNLCVEGISFMPVIKENIPWKEAAFSQNPYAPFKYGPKTKKSIGYSMHTGFYRYAEWHSESVDDSHPTAAFLSDLKEDPLEEINRAYDEDYADIVKELSSKLKQGWRAFMP